MGVTSSKSTPYSEYGLHESGLALAAATVTSGERREDYLPGSSTRSKTWEIARDVSGELVFDVHDPSSTAADDQVAEFIIQGPKTVEAALLKLDVPANGQLDFLFTFDGPTSHMREKGLSIGCASSEAELEQLLYERRRSSVLRNTHEMCYRADTHAQNQHQLGLSVANLDVQPDGRTNCAWTYPSVSRLSGSHHTTSSTSSRPTSLTTGRRFVAVLQYQPNSDSFVTLASFSFWLAVRPPHHVDTVLPDRPPSPIQFSETVTTPATDYLSPQLPSHRRTSWQSDAQGRTKRFSYQSDASRSLSGSPGTANDNHAGFGWQQGLPTRPAVQRSATSPSLGASPLPPQGIPTSPQALEVAPLPVLEPIEDIPEDGPLFKAHCKGMEERAYYLRRSLKHLVRSAEAVLQAGRLLDEAEDAFDVSLHEVSEFSPNSIRALDEVYLGAARRIQGFARKEALLRLEELVIEPLKRLITILKAAETKKKAYEQESKAFYEHVQRYLGVKNDITSSEGKMRTSVADEKHKLKKDRFTIARLEYYNSLRDLAVFKECMTLAILTHYAHAVHDIAVASGRDLDSSTMALDDLDLRLDAMSADIDRKKVEIESKRRQVETSLAVQRMDFASAAAQPTTAAKSRDRDLRKSLEVTHLSPLSDNGALPLVTSSTEGLALSLSPEPDSRWSQPPASPSMSIGQSSRRSSTSSPPAQLRRKEGFLWVNSRPITHQGNIDSIKQWHKTWVVLAGGQLCEYADDRLELNSQPLNLRFATAREARTQDRRFAFEVITPSVRRVYQATSDEEAQAWLKTLLNVIQSLLDGTSSVRQFVRPAGSGAQSELGLGIAPNGRQQAGPGSGKEESPAEGMRGVLAKLQRRTSGSHRKRDSVTSLVHNLANNVRGARRDKDGPRQLATLLEASQSMASFFSDTPRPDSAAAHAKFASGDLEQHRQYRSMLYGGDGVQVQSSPPRTEAELDQGIAAAVNTTFGPTRPGKLSQANKEQNLRELVRLQRLDENRKCADCHAADPRWASWNLGLFICIKCSGVHRALGTHISKVRSLDLDDWSDEQLQSMREGGNKAGRLKYEPPDLPEDMRAESNIANLIRMKYVEQRWNQ